MTLEEHQAIVRELAEAFGELTDVTPAPDQPLHVMLRELVLPPPWHPSPAPALVVFADWPTIRPAFYIDRSVANGDGEPPRSNSEQLVLGATWRLFSFTFDWPENPTATLAVQLWLTRFREAT